MPAARTPEEHAIKTSRVLRLMDEQELDRVLLRSTAGVAWWSGGGATHVPATPEIGVAALVLTRDGDDVVVQGVTSLIEAPRMQTEELPGIASDWTVLPWSEPLETALPTGDRVGTDVPLDGCRDVSGALTRLRASLVPAEVERLESLARDSAQGLTSACVGLRPTDTEHTAAARTAAALLERGVDPVVLLVAGSERLAAYPHPLPTGAPLGELAMLVACGRRAGLIVSLTRYVGTPSPQVQEAFDRILQVDAAVNLATRPGRTVGEVFRELQAAYVEQGFPDDEWTRHHQGGPAGYAPRDHLGAPDVPDVVAESQLFAWNPSAPGVKSEDSVLAGPDGAQVLTVDPDWPVREVRGLRRPLPRPYG